MPGRRDMSREPGLWLTVVLVGIIVLVGGGLRFTHLDWDRGAHLHPDERFLTMVVDDLSAPDGVPEYLDTDGSPLNPANHGHDFVYGTAPVFTRKGVATWLHHGAETEAHPARGIVLGLDAAGVPLLDDAGRPAFDDGYGSLLVGRAISAALDVVTILLVFELGRAVRGRWVAVASAAAYAVAVIAIQHAHFAVVEPMLTTATAAALVAAVHVARRPDRGTRLLLALGGVAAGVAGASKLGGLLVATILAASAAVARSPRLLTIRALRPLALDLAIVAVATFATFRLLQPYAFDGWVHLDARWLDSMRRLAEIHRGGDVPYVVQWADRTPVIGPLVGFARFAFGVPLTVLAVVGATALRRRSTWRTEPAIALLAGWVVLTGALFLPQFVALWRYLLPAVPALAVLAGIGFVSLVRRPGVWRVGAIVVAVAAVAWAVAFANGVYGRTNTRVAAAEWVAAEVPEGSVLSTQEWDDALPFAAIGDEGRFGTEVLKPFSVATPDDVRSLVASLDRIDYVVETSDRITGAVRRVPARYGAVVRYYDALADGTLGFEHVASFRSGPSLLGIDVDDSGSEEAFRVLDHPPVDVWRKTDAFSVERALAVLQPERARIDEVVPLRQAGANGLLLEGDADAPATGPTFDATFGDRLPAPALWWWLWWSVLGWAALPWTTRLLRALPDRGWGLTKLVGPLAVLVPLWFVVAIGLVEFSRSSIAGATAIGLVAGAVSAWRHRGDPERSVRAFVTQRWRAILAIEVIALSAFVAVTALRAANPDLWFHPTGGEKPMAAAYVTAIARSDTFPPPDPWFSGGAMNYYYGTWYLVAAPARLLGISPDIALNLAVATAASLLATMSWSVGTALTSLGSLGRRRVDRAGRRRRAAAGGALAVVTMVVLGNLASARQQLARLDGAVAGRDVDSFDWWAISRVNPTTSDINEFPGWSILFADPHPHLLWAPLLVATVGLLVAYIAARHHGDRRGALGVAAVVGAALGWSRLSHTWDLPTLSVLALGAALAGAHLDVDRSAVRWFRWRRWHRSVGHLTVIAMVALGLSWPYASKSQAFDAGFERSPARTPLGSFATQHGIALTLVAVAVAAGLLRRHRAGELPALIRSRSGRAGVAAMAVGAVLVVAMLAGPVAASCSVVVAAATAFAVWELRSARIGVALGWSLVAAGTALVALPEIVVVVNDIDRMNTVFKFGMTAWVLLALGAAAVTVTTVADAPRPRLAAAVAAVLVMPGLAFWPSAIGSRLDARFTPMSPTLDGRAWLDHGPIVVAANGTPPIDVTADDELIAWMRANAPGGSTIVEAAGPSYSWVSRVSVATGLPTVIGWRSHQHQQRRGYSAEVDERFADVERLYADPDRDQAMRTLAAYRPDYVVVGSVEHALGTSAAIDGLDDLPGMAIAWQGGDQAIYAVDHRAIDLELARIDAARLNAAS